MAFDSDSIHSLFRMGGGWGNISGPGLFMAKAFVSGTIKAAIFGFTGATMCAVFYGTAALPFVVAASAGFAIGTVGFYRDSVSRAFLALEKYPLLIRLHLHSNFPRHRFDSWELRQLRGEAFRGRWSWESMLVASYLSAVPALERIKEQEEDAIVAREIEKLSWVAGSSDDIKS